VSANQHKSLKPDQQDAEDRHVLSPHLPDMTTDQPVDHTASDLPSSTHRPPTHHL